VLRRSLALLTALTALLLASGCADDVSPAARVGDVTVGNDALLHEVSEWAGNQAMIGQTQATASGPGTYEMEFVRQLLQQRITLEVHRREFDKLGLQLDDSLRQQAHDVFVDPANPADPFEAFSEDYAAELIDAVARAIAVQTELGDDGYSEWRSTDYLKVPVEVSPRYGTWDAGTSQIVAPSGPVQPLGAAPAVPGL
jgi:hypothetical protein